jgi:DnaJ-domain-containing protein 1
MQSQIGIWIQKLLQEHFYESQIALGFIFLIIIWFFRNPGSSRFRLKESDRIKKTKASADRIIKELEEESLANAKKAKPLELPGININAPAHEILGISLSATKKEVQSAYKKLMKQYHPDQVSRPGTPQWHEAQKIAAALNKAKDELLIKVNS